MRASIHTPLFITLLLFSACGDRGESGKEKGKRPPSEQGSKKKKDTEENAAKQEDGVDWDRILELTREIYADTEFDDIQERSVKKELEKDYKPPVLTSRESRKAKTFYRFVSFQALEFPSPEKAEKAFEWYRKSSELWSEEGFQRDQDRDRFLNSFYKGGSTYLLTGRFLLHHRLRCNMNEEDYSKDREWTERIEQLHPNGSSFRMECGFKLRE